MSLTDYTPTLSTLLEGNIVGQHVMRPALVQHGVPARVVLPTAGVTTTRARSLVSTGGRLPAREGNAVEYFVSQQALTAMAEAIRTAEPGRGNPFVLLVGWNFEPATTIPGANRRFLDELLDAARRGVDVFLLLWANDSPLPEGSEPRYLRQNRDDFHAPLVTEVAGMEHVHLRLDAETNRLGAHHQKLLIVSGREGLVAFYGGVDVASNRLELFYDVHARVRGPAAADLYHVAVTRWQTARPSLLTANVRRASMGLDGLLGEAVYSHFARGVDPPPPPATGSPGSSLVRVSQTPGNAELREIHGPGDIAEVMIAAIGRARRFIYMEDQYFASQAIADSLAAALPHVSQIILLLNTVSDGVETAHRYAALHSIAAVAERHPGKFGVFTRAVGPRRYVHSKLCIVDDELAVVGSCNLDRRGFETDSEVMVSQVHRIEPAWDNLDLPRPHKLRMQLWYHHLNDFPELGTGRRRYASADIPAWRLVDPIASAVYWMQLDREALPGRATAIRRANPRGRVASLHFPAGEHPHWSQFRLYAPPAPETDQRLGMDADLEAFHRMGAAARAPFRGSR